MEKPGRLLTQGPEPLLFPVPALILRVLGHLQPRPLGQKPHGVGVGEIFNFHDEIDHSAPFVAAKAVVNALLRRNGKGGGLLPVEGTQAKEIAPPPLHRHILTHYILNGIAGHHIVQKGRRKRHRATSFLGACRPLHIPFPADTAFACDWEAL